MGLGAIKVILGSNRMNDTYILIIPRVLWSKIDQRDDPNWIESLETGTPVVQVSELHWWGDYQAALFVAHESGALKVGWIINPFTSLRRLEE